MTDRDAQLNRIIDEHAIQGVLTRMSLGIDGGGWDLFQSCFCDRVNINYEDVFGMPEARIASADWKRIGEASFAGVRRQHRLANFVIDIQDGIASVLVYFGARCHGLTVIGDPTLYEYGYYRAWLVQEAGEWKIARLKHHLGWLEGNAALMRDLCGDAAPLVGEIFSPAAIAAAQEELARRPGLLHNGVAPEDLYPAPGEFRAPHAAGDLHR